MQDGSFLPKDRLHKTSYTLHVSSLARFGFGYLEPLSLGDRLSAFAG